MIMFLVLNSCGDGEKETATSCAKRWDSLSAMFPETGCGGRRKRRIS